jgi:ATP-dependent Clp protease adaptor protein ClpS
VSQTSTISKTKLALKPPSMWHVILHNDDFTPFDFVIELLVVVFNKTPEEATAITAAVHTKGKATVGLYTREIAETKVALSTRVAADYGHPLLTTIQPA